MSTNDILDSNSDLRDDRIVLESITKTKFINLDILSLGLYQIWWMYKVWRYYKEKNNLNIMPAARALFSIFFMYALIEKIQKDAKNKGYEKKYSSGGLFFLFIIFHLLSRLPDPFWIISFLGFLLFLQPLSAFNWAVDKSNYYKLNIRDGFNGKQIVILIVGGLFWLLLVISLFLPEEVY